MKYDYNLALDFDQDAEAIMLCERCPDGNKCPDKTSGGYCTFEECLRKQNERRNENG